MAERQYFCRPAQAVTQFFPDFKEAGIAAGIADSWPRPWPPSAKRRRLSFSPRPSGRLHRRKLLAEAKNHESFRGRLVFTDRGTAAEAARCWNWGPRTIGSNRCPGKRSRPCCGRSPGPARSRSHSRQPGPLRRARPADQPEASGKGFAVVGQHPAIRRVLALARQVARSKATVLISGESGTGKEMFARYLHASSDRADGPFVAINCAPCPSICWNPSFSATKKARLPEPSPQARQFEMASGGTILLDEISEMDIAAGQAPARAPGNANSTVGGSETVQVDVRVLATTTGAWKRPWPRQVPPGPLLPVERHSAQAPAPARARRRHPAPGPVFRGEVPQGLRPAAPGFSSDAKEWLVAYDWPGNVRELQNLMERAVLLAGDGPIRKSHFLLDPDVWPGEAEEGADDDLAMAEDAEGLGDDARRSLRGRRGRGQPRRGGRRRARRGGALDIMEAT